MSDWQLAQLNIATAKFDNDDPRFADFIDNLDRINTLGDGSPGAVWRYTDDSGAAIETQMWDDPRALLNLTVWEDIESLWNYAYKTEHVEFLRRRTEWFEVESVATTVLWWVPAGHRPTPEEAVARLDLLREHGPTAEAFSFRQSFEPPPH
ncbi:MAG: DUF3291 domain-containing protein [Actinomycetota bacterium]